MIITQNVKKFNHTLPLLLVYICRIINVKSMQKVKREKRIVCDKKWQKNYGYVI